MAGKKKIRIRTWLQVFFFGLIALIAVNKTLAGYGMALPFISDASTHAFCPFGGVATTYQYLTAGTFVRKIHESSFILMIIIFTSAFIFGPLFCGWVCPLGSLQEWIGKIGKKLFRTRYNHMIPRKLDRVLRYSRYLVLGWVVYMVAKTGEITVFENVDPYYALFNFWTSEIALGGIIVLGIVILASLAVERPWCKYACPYGAVLGVTNLFSIFRVRRNADSCISCKLCDASCPMNIEISKKEAVRNHQCISCLKCTSEQACPVGNTTSMNMNSKIAAVLMLVILFGGIGISKGLGVWQTESTKIPAAYASGEFAGQYNPGDIRGSYSFGDVSSAFGVPASELAKAFAVNAKDPASFLVKDLATLYTEANAEGKAVETDSLRYFVALYKGLPYEMSEEGCLPAPAVEILKAQAKLTPEQIAYLESHTVQPAASPAGAAAAAPGETAENDDSDTTIKGKTTFNEILDWGVPKEKIEEIIQGKIPSTGMAVRDYCQQQGIEFEAVKTSLQEEVDKNK